MEQCLFCLINNTIPSKKIYEGSYSCVFLDKAEDVNYHMLAIPKKHISNILDCDGETLIHLTNAVQTVSRHCIKCGFSGINILNANGKDAGQSIAHFHIHLIPRKKGDNINAWPNFDECSVSLEDAYALLKNKLVIARNN
ncbi:MAG: HIT family protein [Liquorilactobacillus nagelii]|jgi:histidine triad (HIT) family protein|uniref:HIT family protein n=1 Tax=Liquorilactobacillus nagelii TaxID=82688 RepID=UPI002432E796|nr:HIT family protein [Liquorilactobacillus nagelii]MCI1632528.1 HIT family protein [Liquorilactobacillus nagelii]MCI1920645.1 HIT family protein [Liquorilactobacillus nagelii]MCI1976989.1 HIT family protein [Liquorilactobacillus nagelii]